MAGEIFNLSINLFMTVKISGGRFVHRHFTVVMAKLGSLGHESHIKQGASFTVVRLPNKPQVTHAKTSNQMD
jgi:hypothetical protein